MTTTMRQRILRANALYLLVASIGGLLTDIAGAFFARGSESQILAIQPVAAIGFVEAHGLALIIGVLLWRAATLRSWHFAAVAVHVLLGTANLVFWQIFIVTDMLALGYITTSLHWLFVVLQLFAAFLAERVHRVQSNLGLVS
ncbi:MAG: hypothetical protein ACRENG_19880 [bacterium]